MTIKNILNVEKHPSEVVKEIQDFTAYHQFKKQQDKESPLVKTIKMMSAHLFGSTPAPAAPKVTAQMLAKWLKGSAEECEAVAQLQKLIPHSPDVSIPKVVTIKNQVPQAVFSQDHPEKVSDCEMRTIKDMFRTKTIGLIKQNNPQDPVISQIIQLIMKINEKEEEEKKIKTETNGSTVTVEMSFTPPGETYIFQATFQRLGKGVIPTLRDLHMISQGH